VKLTLYLSYGYLYWLSLQKLGTDVLDLHCIRDRLNGISETFADEKEFISTLYKMIDQYRAVLTVCISKNHFLICISYHVMLYFMLQNFGFQPDCAQKHQELDKFKWQVDHLVTSYYPSMTEYSKTTAEHSGK
jgi:hypothetical protein